MQIPLSPAARRILAGVVVSLAVKLCIAAALWMSWSHRPAAGPLAAAQTPTAASAPADTAR